MADFSATRQTTGVVVDKSLPAIVGSSTSFNGKLSSVECETDRDDRTIKLFAGVREEPLLLVIDVVRNIGQ